MKKERYSPLKPKGMQAAWARAGDIYCAAVSAIIQTAVIGLEECAGLKTAYECRDGYLYCELPKGAAGNIRAAAITQTMLLGLKAFQRENKGYLKIIEEVR